MATHENRAQKYCDYALNVLGAKKLKFRPMRRKNNRVNTRHGYVIGRTNLKTGLITIDIFTPKKREPKKISSILRTLAHEVAHYQKKPFRQRHRGRWITRQHYPEFYRQVTKNIEILREDRVLEKFFK
ncbi:hypothetical protein COV49_04100 [Candidatus Falkowbacteria bacterium CG11_big_fil_rev_8_21_14_0_20_39_10]|uniref:SprT-like domain-containing protein n=1 Tax=Candidatus Falkowbacteria bacterium CG11_big_fil_rev_8_21_14_0_20_39_10 TaxID=1974570 RepID=A0A2M6K8H8_9BACT|nr:MAG: hypothetical protein COV49_04100 [Candidatus Falkowbacteria bacterium CG11_big_fil_rev_8_21_14_0_20_39_10]